jgi:glycosyltransferase involved in cell wall biosynthesis
VTGTRLRVGLLVTHPIQYYTPWYRGLAAEVDLHVFFSHRQTSEAQARAGYGVAFEWDVPVLEGYAHTFLENVAHRPDVNTFRGCDTPAIGAIIAAERFDAFIVHGWSTKSYWQAMRACWRTRTPILVRGDSQLATPRAWWWRAIKAPIFRAFIRRFDGYLVVGTRAGEYLRHYGADLARCFPAPHCVDNAFFSAAAATLRPARAAIRAAFDLPADVTVFLLAGRLVGVKRVDLFLEALGIAARTARVAGLVVGDGPLRAGLEARAAAIAAPIRFGGFLNQRAMPRAYAAADALVVASTSETWGLVVNEAMASGLPAIVSSGTGSAGDLVIAGRTGAIFATGDAADLARHMVALADPATRGALAAGAAAHVSAFGVPAAVAGTMRAIRAVSTGRHAAVAAGAPPIRVNHR